MSDAHLINDTTRLHTPTVDSGAIQQAEAGKEAGGAIAERYKATGGATGFLGAADGGLGTCPDGRGWFQHYKNGSIYWTAATGAHEVHGAIYTLWASHGWEKGLGYPTTDEGPAPDDGGKGRTSAFTGGTIIWTPTGGAAAITGAVPDSRDFNGGWQSVPDPDAAGGPVDLTLRSDGTATVVGHIHDSSAFVPYDYSMVGVLRDAAGQGYSFVFGGHVSHDQDSPLIGANGSPSATNPVIKANWLSICAAPASAMKWSLTAKRDYSSLLSDLETAVGVVGTVVSVFA